MPLNYTHQIFTERWQKGLVKGRTAAMPATVKVFTRTLVTTNNTTTSVETAVYEGSARVQPVRQVRQNSEPGDLAFDQTVRFQLTLSGLLLVPESMFVRVTACVLNPALVNGNVYTLKETTDSSNPIERTFEATVETGG